MKIDKAMARRVVILTTDSMRRPDLIEFACYAAWYGPGQYGQAGSTRIARCWRRSLFGLTLLSVTADLREGQQSCGR